MEMKGHTIRVKDDVWEWLQSLPGKTLDDGLRSLMEPTISAVLDSPAVLEILELVRSLPSSEDIEMVVDVTMQRKIDERAATRPAPAGGGYNPASIPGVGFAGNLPSTPHPGSMRNIGGEMVPTTRENGDKIPWTEQQEIARRQHAEKEAAKDSTAQATGREDVEYDTNWGA